MSHVGKPRLAVVYLTDIRNRSADVVQSFEMCEALSRQFSVRFFHPAISKAALREQLAYWSVTQSMDIIRLAAYGPHRAIYQDFPNRALFLTQVLVNLRLRPVDVIFTRDPSLLYMLKTLPRTLRPKTPLIYEAHKLYHRVSNRVRSSKGELSAISLADRVLAVSPGVKEDLIALGVNQRKVEVLPLGVKLAAFERSADVQHIRTHLGVASHAVIVIYAGSWDEWKGVDTLLRAFAMLTNAHSDCVLVLLGADDTACARARTLLEELDVSADRYILRGHIARRDLIMYLRASDIGVLPNANTMLSGFYTSPLKAFEYLAAGLAIIASDLPALRSILTEAETVFCNPNDKVDLAQKLSTLISADTSRKRRQEAARCRAKRYDYTARCRRIWEIYQDLVSEVGSAIECRGIGLKRDHQS